MSIVDRNPFRQVMEYLPTIKKPLKDTLIQLNIARLIGANQISSFYSQNRRWIQGGALILLALGLLRILTRKNSPGSLISNNLSIPTRQLSTPTTTQSPTTPQPSIPTTSTSEPISSVVNQPSPPAPLNVNISLIPSPLVEPDRGLLKKFDHHFSYIKDVWISLSNLLATEIPDERARDQRDQKIQNGASGVLTEIYDLLAQLINYGIELQVANGNTSDPDPSTMHAEITSRCIRAMHMAQNLNLVNEGISLPENLSTIPPGGANNGPQGTNNVCYISTALHMLRVGYQDRLNEIEKNKDASDTLRYLARLVDRLAKGETLEAETMLNLATQLSAANIITEEARQQACAKELLQNLLAELNVDTFTLQKARYIENEEERYSTVDIRNLDCAIQNPSGQDAYTLNEALHFEMLSQVEGYCEEGVEVLEYAKFDPQSLPDVLTVSLKRMMNVWALPSIQEEPIEEVFPTDIVENDQDLEAILAKLAAQTPSSDALSDSQLEAQMDKLQQEDMMQQGGIKKLSHEVLVDDVWTIPHRFVAGDLPVIYQLAGFAVHDGDNAANGHYRAFSHQAGTWYEMNDDKVIEVPVERRLLEQNKAYIYIFKKVLQKT